MKRHVVNEPQPGDVRKGPEGRLYEFVEEEDAEWGRVRHFRTVDTLGRMLKAGTITPAMHDAGRQFQEDFARAFASGYTTPRRDALPAGTAPVQTLVEKHVGAARAVRRALDAVGGMGSPAGSALWYVVWLGQLVREWALREGWAGRAISLHEARGILVAGLGVLARYYGFAK